MTNHISRLGGLAVLFGVSLTVGFHVSSAEAAPFVYVTTLTPSAGGPFPPGTVSVIDTATSTVVATVSVDGAPVRVAVTPDGKQAYLAIEQSKGSVAVLDTATNTIATTVPVGDFCIGGIAITPDGKHAYVANCSNDNIVTVLDTATKNVAATVPNVQAIDIAISPDGKHAYATTFEGVAVIDTKTNTVATTIQVGKGSSSTKGRGIAVTPDGKKAYLTNGGTNDVSVNGWRGGWPRGGSNCGKWETRLCGQF